MAYNVPSYETDNFSFGPGVLYIGVAGATPTIDIGGVRAGAEFSVTREILEVRQGSPASLVKQYATREDAMLRISGIEWNLERISEALGAGVATTSASQDTLEFGGDINIANVALRFVHETPAGHTVTLDLFTAQGVGELTLTFGDELHEMPYSFKALETLTDWAGSSLASNKRLWKITKQKV